MIFFDFEVSKDKWFVTFLVDNEFFVIDNKKDLLNFHIKYKNQVWCGYNAFHFDKWIFMAIMLDEDPYKITQIIINGSADEQWAVRSVLNKYVGDLKINVYDCAVGQRPNIKGLKEVLGLYGLPIIEFDVEHSNLLNKSDYQKAVEYCKNDVKYLPWIVDNLKWDEIEVKSEMIKLFNLKGNDINLAYSSMISKILDAKRVKRIFNKYYTKWPEKLEVKNEKVINFYKKELDFSKKLKIKFERGNGSYNYIFGFGGLHLDYEDTHKSENNYCYLDVSSYYPSLMKNFNLLSRNCSEKGRERYFQFLNNRLNKKLEIKTETDKRKSIMEKVILNTAFGASNSKYNALYDPEQAVAVTITGQLLLWDLIEKINEVGQVVYVNTDGLIFEYLTKNHYNKIMNIIENWKTRFSLGITLKNIKWFIFKDTNNYIIKFENNDIDYGGAQVNMSDIFLKDKNKTPKNNTVVHNAVLDYFINKVKPEDSIENENDVLKFQLIRKTGKMYDRSYVLLGNVQVPINKSINRIFASKDKTWGRCYKIKEGNTSGDLIAALPNHCLVKNKILPDISEIDKSWYIKVAWNFINMLKRKNNGNRQLSFLN